MNIQSCYPLLMNERKHPLEEWLEARRLEGKPHQQYQLAKELKCSPSRLSQIIHNRDTLSLALAGRIKALTGISVDEILAAARSKEDVAA